jgi:hypothetical protein
MGKMAKESTLEGMSIIMMAKSVKERKGSVASALLSMSAKIYRKSRLKVPETTI